MLCKRKKRQPFNKIEAWQLLSRRKAFTALPWVKVYVDRIRLPSGRVISDFYAIDLPEFVLIYAQARNGKVLCQSQYHYADDKTGLSLPAGCLEKKESPLEAAKREFREETGYMAQTWKFIGSYCVDSRRGCGKAHLFTAKGLKKISRPLTDEMEEGDIFFIPPSRLIEAVMRGEVISLAVAFLISLATNPSLAKGGSKL